MVFFLGISPCPLLLIFNVYTKEVKVKEQEKKVAVLPPFYKRSDEMTKRKNRIRIEANLSKEEKEYIKRCAKFHHLTVSEFILKQCSHKEFIEVNFKEIDTLLRLFGNLTNNMNQVARILNYAKKNNSLLKENDIKIMESLLLENRENYRYYEEEIKKGVFKINRIIKKNKIREVN